MDNAVAKNCGIIGATYPIAEKDLRQVIQQRLLTLQKNGELAQLTANLNQALQQQMDRPQPVLGLQRTQQRRAWFFNSSVSLSETLLFYNADDPAQVRWAQRENNQFNYCKLILVGGSVVSQMKLFKKPVYFDQGGQLIARFHIKHVPAIVTQQGHQLKIEEVMP